MLRSVTEAGSVEPTRDSNLIDCNLTLWYAAESSCGDFWTDHMIEIESPTGGIHERLLAAAASCVHQARRSLTSVGLRFERLQSSFAQDVGPAHRRPTRKSLVC